MKKLIHSFACLCVFALLTPVAMAQQVVLNSVRVAAVDSVALSKFYMKAFGMREVNRIPMQAGNFEIFLNFGANDAEAKANSAAQIVITHRDSDATSDTIPHIVFTVTDVKATAAMVKAAGGSMEREPFEFNKTGIMIGMAKDPVGNQIELIQQPKK